MSGDQKATLGTLIELNARPASYGLAFVSRSINGSPT